MYNEDKNEQLFNTVMDNLNAFGYNEDGKTIMRSGIIPLSICKVDERYQGLRTHKRKIDKLITNWDVRKLTPIIVVPHYEESCFAIIDGKGRYIAAMKKGITKLQGIALMDAPSDISERDKFEADYFISQGEEDEVLKPIEKHLARVMLGEKPAVIINKLAEKYEIDFSPVGGKRSRAVLGSYTDTYAIAKNQGEECLEFIFSIINNAGWHNEVNGYATYTLRALKNIWLAHPAKRKEIHRFLSRKLRQIDPELFSSKSRAAYPQRDYRCACSLYIEDMVCEELGIKREIYDGGNVYSYPVKK